MAGDIPVGDGNVPPEANPIIPEPRDDQDAVAAGDRLHTEDANPIIPEPLDDQDAVANPIIGHVDDVPDPDDDDIGEEGNDENIGDPAGKFFFKYKCC